MERELKEIRDEVESLQRDEHTRLEREKKVVLDRIKDEVWHVTLCFLVVFCRRAIYGGLNVSFQNYSVSHQGTILELENFQ